MNGGVVNSHEACGEEFTQKEKAQCFEGVDEVISKSYSKGKVKVLTEYMLLMRMVC